MAFKTGNEDFEKVFGEEKTITAQFLEKLTDFLETRKMITPFVEIYERIRKGKNLSAFACRYDLAADMTEILGENEIPCIKVLAPNGKIGFIVSSDDENAVLDLQQELLKRLGRFMPVHSGEKLRSLIDGKKRKSVVSLSGLTKAEAFLLKNYCQKETQIQAMGIDSMSDGTYKVSVFSADLLPRGEHDMTFAQELIKVKLLLSGKYGREIAIRIDRQAKYEELVASRFNLEEANRNKDLYLLGEGDQYVKLNREAMEYGKVESVDCEIHFSPVVTVPSVFPNYQENVISYTGMLVNPIIAKNEHELSAALSLESIAISNAELKEHMSEKAILVHIAKMIDDKKEFDPVLKQSGEYEKKFEHLVDKSRMLMEAAISGNFPHEYSEAEQAAFREVLDKNRIDLSEYEEVLAALKEVEVRVEEKEIEKIRDLSEYTLDHEQSGKDSKTPTREDLGV